MVFIFIIPYFFIKVKCPIGSRSDLSYAPVLLVNPIGLHLQKNFDIIYLQKKVRYIPMFDTNEILARLQNGESSEAIVAQFTDAINAANAEYTKLQNEEIAKAEKAAEHESMLNAAAEDVADAIWTFVSLAHPELPMSEADRMTGAEVRQIIEQMMPMMNLMTRKPKTVRVKVKGADEAFNDFFKMFGL
jgi:hypothetical protein